MKIVPVPIYMVLDGFAKDLAVAEVAERMKFLLDIEEKDSVHHALDFCKACATHYYGASACNKIPTIRAGAFASIPSEADKAWAVAGTKQLYPTLVTVSPPPALGDNATTAIAVAVSLNAKMLEMMNQGYDGRKSGRRCQAEWLCGDGARR